MSRTRPTRKTTRPRSKQPGPTWMNQREFAQRVLEVSPQCFRQSYARLIPDDLVRPGGPGEPKLYHVRAALDAIYANRLPQLGTDPDSPALERYRLARARLTELELERRRDSLVSVAQIQAAIGFLGEILREAGGQLRQRFGPDAQAVIVESLDEAEQVLRRSLDPHPERGTAMS